MCCGNNSSSDNNSVNNQQPDTGNFTKIAVDTNVYRDIVYFQDKFLAFGTGGRIDMIDQAGTKTNIRNPGISNLNFATICNQALVVAGDNGSILHSIDGKVFTDEESGTDDNIYGITCKNGLLVAGSGNGTLLVSKNGRSWSIINTNAKGNIISLTSNNSFFIGVSDRGEVIKSNDGLNWQVTDYNETYAGFNRYSYFRKILAGQNSIVIIGTHDDGTPAVLFSTLGNVWTERTLVYDDENGVMQFLVEKPNDIIYDPDRDQFVLACDEGIIFTLPTCTKCNTYTKVADGHLSALAYSRNILVVAGEEYSLNIFSL